ncbi:hypothetical protein NP493_736g00043 [Ridgeia piscesae]|uniref:Uncharacterized protein n=1 Tax=Ridgeia piscesae TaxID=27915 RepID=A0AAD9NM33_RIDPI|nr:hypothetical protein NP493_736g00043 [Ridgeia piscesae]
MYAQYTYLFVDGSRCQLSICIWFSATNTFRSTSCSKQIISNPTFRNTQQSTFINMLRALPSCSHFMTAEKLLSPHQQIGSASPPVDTISASFFVSSLSRVSFFSWSLASSVSSNTCLCLCGWNLYPDNSASVKCSSDEDRDNPKETRHFNFSLRTAPPDGFINN